MVHNGPSAHCPHRHIFDANKQSFNTRTPSNVPSPSQEKDRKPHRSPMRFESCDRTSHRAENPVPSVSEPTSQVASTETATFVVPNLIYSQRSRNVKYLSLPCLERVGEYQRYDGWFNNLANPEWGSVGSRLHRDSPSNYQDGVYRLSNNLPSARAISDLVFRGPAGIPSRRNLTTMLAFFSQVVAYEIMQSTQISCPLEMHKIPVPRCDPVFDQQCEGKTEIPFTRAKYDKSTGHGLNSPREQVNDRTSWIDASFLYSTQEPWVAALRSFENGTLLEGPMPGYPPFNNPHIPLINPPPPQIHRLMNPERLFILGDPRINENPGLLSFGLILYRWHNINAKNLKQEYPEWTDEELFQGARRIVISTLQNIIIYDFLPALLGIPKSQIPSYEGYKPHVPPGISHSFATTAFRFPHSLVPPGLLLRKNTGRCEFREEVGGYPALRLCQNWWNAQDIVQEYSVDEIVLGMASQIAEDEDNIVVEDLRDFIFGPMHFTRLDVVSISIMRGRDNGIPTYNQMRKSFNLPPRTWETINPEMYRLNASMFHQLADLYGSNIDRLDAYVGGMLETNGTGPGELFTKIIFDQFLRLRNSDRFWFENTQNGFLTDEEISAIRNISLREIIRQTTSIGIEELQKDVFFCLSSSCPCPQPFQVNTTNLEQCVPFMRFDHFTGNEVTYIFTLVGLASIPIICIGIGYLLIQKRKKLGMIFEPGTRSLMKTCIAPQRVHVKESSADTVYSTQIIAKDSKFTLPAIEWLNESFCRSVLVELDAQAAMLRILKRRGKGTLRRLDFSDAHMIRLTVTRKASRSVHGPFVVVSVPKNYDMVLRLQNEAHWLQFRNALGNCLAKHGKYIKEIEAENDVLLEAAETKDKRQEKLDHFFREAYSRAFNQPKLSDSTSEFNSYTSEQVLHMTLTKQEFADALGMRVQDLFVQRMFACMAQSNGNTDSVCFQEFLNVLKRFTQGTLKEKLQLVFEMCDRNGDGQVQKLEFCEFVKSLNVAAGVRIDQNIQNDVIESVLHRAGIDPDRIILTYKDFEAIFSQMDDVRRPMGVHLRGANLKVNLEETQSLNSFAVTSASSVYFPTNSLSLLLSYLETYRQHIVILFLFYSANAIVFLERFWHYRYENEHRDLRRVMGVGIAITRGAAAALSFDMALILLTVCRNILTVIRESFLVSYLPLDSAITFHKIVGVTIGVFAAIHTIGHCVNFYHVATQSQEGLACLFQEAVFGSNFLPSISYWFFGTITGITGILLVAVMSIIYVFSAPAVMKRAYHAFRITHLLNVLLYALTILHGLPKLLDSPKFWYIVLGPAIIFIFDRIIGMRKNYKQLRIVDAGILPSDIIYIQFKRPHSFKFRSGQWVRVSCPAFSCTFNEHHAFSLASAPQAPTLELYIKAIGPWTWKLRNEIIESQSNGLPYPVVNLNGPFGDGNQEWHNYEVVVMVGGGIGVTPYASTLMDLVLEKASGNHSGIKCKKVYFLWICPTHKNFEWFVDVLKDVETLDTEGILEIHIFVTQFFHKFDLRTTVLYICEKHFRGDNRGLSMFTGLRAVNHFGRPNFDLFLKFLQSRHQQVNEIGVFSCGPASVNKQIRRACTEANRFRDAPSFVHRFETF
ncbi:heme peroxidase domain-containing protein [Ditylenchus destructor]|nr:heme peroxidase domain-containing protein [Ditylenchus destructor]